MGESTLFLHFLNRELNRAVGISIPANKYETELKVLILLTSVPLYTNYANILEGAYLESDFYKEIIRLEILFFYAENQDLSQYLKTREERYFFDKERYSHLINFDPVKYDIIPNRVRDFSMTSELKRQISNINYSGNDDFQILSSHKGNEGYWNVIELIANHNGQEAVTMSLVEKLISPLRNFELDQHLRGQIGKLLAILYFDLNTKKLNADIPSGIRNLNYFDYLAKNFPLYDIALLNACLFSCGFNVDELKFDEIIHFRFSEEQSYCSQRFSQILKVIYILKLSSFSINMNLIEKRNIMLKIISECQLGKQRGLKLKYLPNRIERFIDNLDKKIPFLKNYINAEDNMTKTILVLTATSKESKAVLNEAKRNFSIKPEVFMAGGHATNYLGMIHKYKIYHAQCEAGSGGPSGSQAVASDLIPSLSPDKILMPGIAFGLQKKNQKIGDILVSTKIFPYEMQRVGQSMILSRGDIVPASPSLLSVLRNVSLSWNKSNMHFGIIMSGEKLVDNGKFVKKLKELQPEAIGGEMEGAGLYAVAYRKKVDWIVFKSIVDWGMGKTDDAQSHSSSLASEVLFEAIKILVKST